MVECGLLGMHVGFRNLGGVHQKPHFRLLLDHPPTTNPTKEPTDSQYMHPTPPNTWICPQLPTEKKRLNKFIRHQTWAALNKFIKIILAMDFSNINATSLDEYHKTHYELISVVSKALKKYIDDLCKKSRITNPFHMLEEWWKANAPDVEIHPRGKKELCAYISSLLVLSQPQFEPSAFENEKIHLVIRDIIHPKHVSKAKDAAPLPVEQRMLQMEKRIKQICDYLQESGSEESDDCAGCKACGKESPAIAKCCMHCGQPRATATANVASNPSSLSANGASKTGGHADYVSCQTAMHEINEALSKPQSGHKFRPHLGAKHLLQFPEHWPSLVQNDSTDNGLSMASLISKLQAECITQNASANHHGEVLLDLIPLILRNDKVGALTLCSDRLQFLRKMGKGKPLPYCDAFYSELRGEDEQHQRVKSADLKAKWLTPAAKAKQHVYDQLSKEAGASTDGQAAAHDTVGVDPGAFKGGKRRGRGKRH